MRQRGAFAGYRLKRFTAEAILRPHTEGIGCRIRQAGHLRLQRLPDRKAVGDQQLLLRALRRAIRHAESGHRHAVAVGRNSFNSKTKRSLYLVIRSGRHPSRSLRRHSCLLQADQSGIDQSDTQPLGDRRIHLPGVHRPVAAQQDLLQPVGREACAAVVGHNQRRHTRHVRTGHRGARHVDITVGRIALLLVPSGAEHLALAAELRVAHTGTARRQNIDIGADVGVAGPRIVGTHGRHADDALLLCRRRHLHGIVVVAGREKDHAARHRSRLVAEIILAALVDKIFERHAQVLGGLIHVGEVPAVLTDHRPVVGRIDVSRHAGRRIVARRRIKRTGHQPHAVALARTAGHTAHAHSVVVYRSHRTGHMGTVGTRRQIARILIEVIAIDIVHVAVAVIIQPVAGDFPRVDPHAGSQVLVLVIDGHIHDRHNDRRITGPAGGILPHVVHTDVRSFHRTGHRAVVVIVPLPFEHGVVKRRGVFAFAPAALPAILGGRQRARTDRRSVNGRIRRPHPVDGPHIRHLVFGGKPLGSAGHSDRFVDLHVIPQVQAVTTVPVLETGIVREYAPHLRSPQFVGQPVDPGMARGHRAAREPAGTQRTGLLLETDTHPSGHNVRSVLFGRRLLHGNRTGRLLPASASSPAILLVFIVMVSLIDVLHSAVGPQGPEAHGPGSAQANARLNLRIFHEIIPPFTGKAASQPASRPRHPSVPSGRRHDCRTMHGAAESCDSAAPKALLRRMPTVS